MIDPRLQEAFAKLTPDERQLLTCALAGNQPPRLAEHRFPVLRALARVDNQPEPRNPNGPPTSMQEALERIMAEAGRAYNIPKDGDRDAFDMEEPYFSALHEIAADAASGLACDMAFFCAGYEGYDINCSIPHGIFLTLDDAKASTGVKAGETWETDGEDRWVVRRPGASEMQPVVERLEVG